MADINKTNIYSTDLVGKKESVVDQLLLLNPYQTPMVNLVGFGQSVSNVEHIWYEDEMVMQESTVSATHVAGDTVIAVADLEPFRPAQIVKVGNELMLIASINVATSELTVVRGFAGTAAGSIAAGASIEAMFVEGDEGSDAREGRYKPRKRVSNLTQIFDDTVELSGTTMAIAQWGVDNEYEKEKQKKQLELALQLEKAVINGVSYENGTKRLMRGVRDFVETNVIDGQAAAIDDSKLVAAFQAVFEAGGFNSGGDYKVMVGAKQKVAISNLSNALVRLSRSENSRGVVVDHYVSDFGQAEIVLNKNLKSDEVFIIDANRISIRPLQGREFSHTFLGKQGDYMKGMLVGEYTLEFLQEKAHAKIINLA
jgi:hypothetical protein